MRHHIIVPPPFLFQSPLFPFLLIFFCPPFFPFLLISFLFNPPFLFFPPSHFFSFFFSPSYKPSLLCIHKPYQNSNESYQNSNAPYHIADSPPPPFFLKQPENQKPKKEEEKGKGKKHQKTKKKKKIYQQSTHKQPTTALSVHTHSSQRHSDLIFDSTIASR